MSLSAFVSGTLTLAPAPDASADSESTGCSFGLSIRDDNKSPQTEGSSGRLVIASPGGFQLLPFPSNLEATVLYIRMKTSDVIDVRLTQKTTGTTVIKELRGMLLMEVSRNEAITAVEIQGNATIEWAPFGPLA